MSEKKNNNDSRKHSFTYVLGTLVLICGVIFFAFFSLVLFILKEYMSAIICLIATIILIPPIYRKIPSFSGKNIVSCFICFVMFCVAMILIPTDAPSSLEDDVANESSDDGKEETVKENSKTEKAISIETVSEIDKKEEITEKEIEEEIDVVINADGKLSTETYMKLYQWIDENIDYLHSHADEFNEKEAEQWAEKVPNNLFYGVWCDVVTDDISSDYALDKYGVEIDVDYVANFVDYMYTSMELYDKVFPNDEWINENIKFPVDAIDELKNDIASLAASIPSGEIYDEVFYISQRLDNDFVSKATSEESSWVAYGVEYDALLEIYLPDYGAGIKAVIVTTIENPFSKADKYQIQYTNTGKTRQLETSNGFVTTVPEYSMVSMGSNNMVIENTNAINQCWVDLGEWYYELMGYLY